eukprot:3685180-Amphidinium_carterae.1
MAVHASASSLLMVLHSLAYFGRADFVDSYFYAGAYSGSCIGDSDMYLVSPPSLLGSGSESHSSPSPTWGRWWSESPPTSVGIGLRPSSWFQSSLAWLPRLSSWSGNFPSAPEIEEHSSWWSTLPVTLW